MATQTGTYKFGLTGADLSLECLDRLQIRGPAITIDHLSSIANSFNLVQSEWSNRGVNLWEIVEMTIPLVQGTATYPIDVRSMFLAPEAFLRTTVNTVTKDIVLFPLSRAEFAAIPSKTQQSRPTSYWFDRLLSPTITLWPVPDANGPYELHYWRASQQQDMNATLGALPDIPYRFYEAFCAEVTAHMAMKWRPEIWDKLLAYATERWKEAAGEDREKVSLYIAPDFSGYY